MTTMSDYNNRNPRAGTGQNAAASSSNAERRSFAWRHYDDNDLDRLLKTYRKANNQPAIKRVEREVRWRRSFR